MPIPVIIVTGFLGCGKTTFLRHLLPVCGEVGIRPALVINEVGDVDVDGELLDDLNAQQARLVGGCVCCTLQAQLATTLDDLLARRAADCIIIECSGLSNPIDVISVLSAPALLRAVAVTHVVCLLDSPRATKVLAVAELAHTQVRTADVLILNKMDKLPAEGRPALAALAREQAPRAVPHEATFGDIGHDALRALLTGAPARHTCDGQCGHAHGAHGRHHELPASFCTVAAPLPSTVARPALETLLRGLPDNVIRAKGFAHVPDEGWAILHRVYDSIDIVPFTGVAPSVGAVLICIGQHLDADRIHALVAALPEAQLFETASYPSTGK